MTVGPLPALLAPLIWALVGAAAAAAIDRAVVSWRPPVIVPAAMGTAALVSPGWWAALPLAGWLVPALAGQFSRPVIMRAVTELIGALAFASLTRLDLQPVQLLLRAGLVLVLLIIFRVDWQYHLILDPTILIGLLLAGAAALLVSPMMLLATTLSGLGAAAVFLFFYLLARLLYGQAALGFGDVLLAGLIGAAVGPAAVAGTLFLGMLLASLGGLVVSLARRRNLRSYFAYGSYLAIAAIVALATPGLPGRLPGFF